MLYYLQCLFLPMHFQFKFQATGRIYPKYGGLSLTTTQIICLQEIISESKFVGTLLTMLFPKSVLKNSTLTGISLNGSKAKLDVAKINFVRGIFKCLSFFLTYCNTKFHYSIVPWAMFTEKNTVWGGSFQRFCRQEATKFTKRDEGRWSPIIELLTWIQNKLIINYHQMF